MYCYCFSFIQTIQEVAIDKHFNSHSPHYYNTIQQTTLNTFKAVLNENGKICVTDRLNVHIIIVMMSYYGIIMEFSQHNIKNSIAYKTSIAQCNVFFFYPYNTPALPILFINLLISDGFILKDE